MSKTLGDARDCRSRNGPSHSSQGSASPAYRTISSTSEVSVKSDSIAGRRKVVSFSLPYWVISTVVSDHNVKLDRVGEFVKGAEQP